MVLRRAGCGLAAAVLLSGPAFAAAVRIRPPAPAVRLAPTAAPRLSPPAAPPALSAAPGAPVLAASPLAAPPSLPAPRTHAPAAAAAKALRPARAAVRALARGLPPALKLRRPSRDPAPALSSLLDGAGRRSDLSSGMVLASARDASPIRRSLGPRSRSRSAGRAAPPSPGAGRLTALERFLFRRLGRLEASGWLKPLIKSLVSSPLFNLVRSGMDPEARAEAAYRLHLAAAAELATGGWRPGVERAEGWEAMGERHMAAVRASRFPPRGPGQPSLLAEPRFVEELEALSGARFEPGHEVRPLVDGPASFTERDRLIRSARESIHLMAWAIYDDATGEETADLLVAKRREGIRVRVMVDAHTARLKGHGPEVLKRLEEAGVEMVRFLDPDQLPYDGLHTKALIVDGRYAIAGGMNVGDPYSHRGAGPKWRDTDVLYEGPAVARTARVFAELWNEQVRAQGLPYALIEPPAPAPAAGGKARAIAVAQRPGGKDELLLHQLKAIAGASRLVRIENAYFITFPSLRRALLEALGRGVRVQILTNSLESADEPIVGVPILESLPELLEAGAEVYLKEGETLHSKFMTVDGLFASVTSFNLHPRSVRYELELALSVLDAGFAAELDAAFEADVARARRLRSPRDIHIPRTWLTRLVRRYFFNQL